MRCPFRSSRLPPIRLNVKPVIRWEDDQGGIVVSWLAKVTVVLIVLGVVGFDVMSVATLQVRVQDAADSAAFAASDATSRGWNQQVATDAAQKYLDSRNTGFSVVPESITALPGNGVQLEVTGDTTTLLMHYIPPLREYTHASKTGTAHSV